MVGVLSVAGLIAPGRLTQRVVWAVGRPWGIYLAVGIRLLLGVALIYAAPASRFPLAFQVLGWITLAAAAGIAVLGRSRLRGLVQWVARRPSPVVRSWLALGAALGGFLVYGIR